MNGNLKEEETIYQTERKQKSKTPARINQESIYIYFTWKHVYYHQQHHSEVLQQCTAITAPPELYPLHCKTLINTQQIHITFINKQKEEITN